MRPAPAVTVRWRTGPAWLAAALLLSILALATSLAWAWLKGGGAWLLPLASAAMVGLGLWPLRPRPAQRLRWDGHDWWLTPTGAASHDDAEEQIGQVAVALDLGQHLLLRFVPTERPGRTATIGLPGIRWLALSRRATDGDWHGLRCALHSSGPAGAEPAAVDPPA
ncbi:hypothetical protein [Rivibacter subsaxonicus]|uniref:Toxin CptA n=1 Tax=Rivibacter subsaxonicus TaxID=457575 RepID=A0A4Q7VGU7_9BURK|nr:hypothetical protein [Rivibacter subsaxonicus]RZT95269.1 hypothetical protein EV670_3020 [Rivibacter subsaxonicus]